MHRLEGFGAALHIEAYCVDDPISVRNSRGNGCIVMDVGHRRLRTWLLLLAKKHTSALGMPRGDPHQEFVVAQIIHNAATDKARAAKHGHSSISIPVRHFHTEWSCKITETSSIDLAEYDVERSNDRGNIRKHVALREEIHGREMGK